jgi:uncharacterized SAM-binding protein YcdF (DUF218 family)
VSVLVVVQGQRDESRAAGIALVVDAGRGPEDGVALAELDHAIALQQQGMVERILLPGDAKAAESQRYLIGRGTPAAQILTSDPAPTLRERVAQSAATARTAGVSRILIVAQPSSMLRMLKITHDQGMDTYASPVTPPIRGRTYLDMIRDTLREALAYLGYILGRG